MLTRRGVTAWRRALAQVTPPARPLVPATTPVAASAAAPALPGPLAAELVNALAAVALAGT